MPSAGFGVSPNTRPGQRLPEPQRERPIVGVILALTSLLGYLCLAVTCDFKSSGRAAGLLVALSAGMLCQATVACMCDDPWISKSNHKKGEVAPTMSPSVVKPDPPGPGAYPYPAVPRHDPPVAPPKGEGAQVRLERYIVADQFGYRPEMDKVAVLADPVAGWGGLMSYRPGPNMEVRRWSDAAVVFRGKPKVWNHGNVDKASGDRGYWFDFSSVKVPGTYYVYDPEHRVRSYPFEVAKNVYRPVLQAAMKMYYFNRANFEKRPPYSCVGRRCWSMGKDHLGPRQDSEARSVKDKTNPATERDLSGGWWDAGDTNKYVTFAGNAVHQLLTAYEEKPSAFTDDFDIPESGNGVSDLLDELKVELDWLEKMQPPDLHGGVLLKVGTVENEQIIPDKSKLARYYYPQPCSSSTIMASSMFAHAALVFGKVPSTKAYAEGLTQRAEKAWDYFNGHPRSADCDDGSIKSGDADRSLDVQAQDAVTAAVYLYAVTKDPKYGRYIKEKFTTTRPFHDDRWSVYEQSQGDALLAYAEMPFSDPGTKAAIQNRLRALAATVEIFGFKPDLDLYRAYMRPDSYHWGSNNARAAFGNTNYDLVQYALVKQGKRADFLLRAEGMLHSFHGVNPMQLVYLTNMYAFGGDYCADEMFHVWFRDGDPVWDNARTSKLGPAPGFVTGGPNAQYCSKQPKDHACTSSPVREQPPGKAYVDTNRGWEPRSRYDKSWELTEPAIYYQASYIRLVSKFVN